VDTGEQPVGRETVTVMVYSQTVKDAMIRKLAMPGGKSANALARESGISQSTLSQWLLDAATLEPMKRLQPKTAMTSPPRRPQDLLAEERLQRVWEAARLTNEELGAFLRTHGLHEAQLQEWRQAALDALAPRRGRVERKPPATRELEQRLEATERDLQRKDKALAEAATLVLLKKKVQAIWGDVDDDTPERNGR
jgi:transposase-like protein